MDFALQCRSCKLFLFATLLGISTSGCMTAGDINDDDTIAILILSLLILKLPDSVDPTNSERTSPRWQ